MNHPVVRPTSGELSPRFDDALSLAHAFHRSQFRKETDIPYIAHLLQVAGLVLEAGGDEDQGIAALLHDAIEDAATSAEAIERKSAILERFDERVLRLIEACTDGDPAQKEAMGWKERKERYVRHLENAGDDVLLISVADKLHNARAILRDYRDMGERLWQRFTGRKSGSLWYYRTLARFYESRGVPLARDLVEVVEELERLATRGSRRHVLNWVESPDFLASLNALLQPTGAVVGPMSEWRPRGWNDPEEARLDGRGIGDWPDIDWEELRTWWLSEPRAANVPNWDLLATCDIGGRGGLVLVEAKAHDGELSLKGKKPPSETPGSRANHEQIGSAIEAARAALDRAIPGSNISRDQAYQLSNRIAHAWWLARHGVPVVLVYLGFTGDERIADVGKPFADDADWQEHFRSRAEGILPPAYLEGPVDCGDATFQVVVRSMDVPEDRS